MSGSSIGKIFKVTTFGESHGAALGVVIDGCPAGLDFDLEYVQKEMDKRKPGSNFGDQKNPSVTARKENDIVHLLSGVFDGKTIGTPIALLINNTSQKSTDYSNIKNVYRPGHADFTYDAKYGIRDYRGGGRSSGRETCARVAGGAVAKMILDQIGVKITAYTERAAGISIDKSKINFENIEKNPLRAPDLEAAEKMNERIKALAEKGDSCGGIIACEIEGCPAGLGETVFEKADALLAQAMLSIGAVKGIEFGAGFGVADMTGSQNNDSMDVAEDGKPVFETNNSGGILGGMTNGNKIFFRLPVKPVPSIYLEQKSIKNENGNFEDTKLKIEGRHDTCICPRVIPVVESMAAIVLADLYLQNKVARQMID